MRVPAFIISAVVLALVVGGCVTAEQIAQAREKAVAKAESETYERVKKEAEARGVPAAEAITLAQDAAKLAGETAGKAFDEAAKAGGSGGLGKVLTGLLYVLVNFGLPMLGGKTA